MVMQNREVKTGGAAGLVRREAGGRPQCRSRRRRRPNCRIGRGSGGDWSAPKRSSKSKKSCGTVGYPTGDARQRRRVMMDAVVALAPTPGLTASACSALNVLRASVYRQRARLHDARQNILDGAFNRNPERFVKKEPEPPAKPIATWINPLPKTLNTRA